MPRGYLKNFSYCSRKQKRGGGSKHRVNRHPHKKVKHQSKSQTTKQTSDFISDNQMCLRLSKKMKQMSDFTFDYYRHLSEENTDSDYESEYEIFSEMIIDEEEQKKNAEIKYHKSLCFDIEVSSSDSTSFLDHIQKICFSSKELTLTHKQVEDYPPQGNIVFTSKHKYFVENAIITYQMNDGEQIQINSDKNIFRKVFIDNKYCCDGCGCEAASTIEPDPNPKLTFLGSYDFPPGYPDGQQGDQGWDAALHRDLCDMKHSDEYDSPYIFRPFVTTRYPDDFLVSTCGYCADPNETIHFDFCLDCFNEKYPLSVVKIKLFFHRLLKNFQIPSDLEISIVEMLL